MSGVWKINHSYRAYDEQLHLHVALHVAAASHRFAKAVGHLAASIESYTDMLHRKDLQRSFMLPPGVDPDAAWRGYRP